MTTAVLPRATIRAQLQASLHHLGMPSVGQRAVVFQGFEHAGVLLVTKKHPDDEYDYKWIDSEVVLVHYSNLLPGQ